MRVPGEGGCLPRGGGGGSFWELRGDSQSVGLLEGTWSLGLDGGGFPPFLWAISSGLDGGAAAPILVGLPEGAASSVLVGRCPLWRWA